MATDPSTQQLRLLLALADELHFGRAARRMFVSQPALSRTIRALEELWGVTLVDRSTRRAELTAAGRDLLPHARAVVEAADTLRDAVREVARDGARRLRIGSYLSALPALRIMFEELRARHGAPEVDWRDVDNVEQVGALLDGRLDAVVCYGPVPEGIRALALGSETRFVCLPDRHPLADRDEVSLAQLADLPVVGFSPHVHPRWREFWAADPRPDGRPVRYTAHEVTTLESSIAHVSLGHGIRFISESCRALMPRPGVRYVAVTDLPPCTALLAWPATRPSPPALVHLRRLLRERAAAHETGNVPTPGGDGVPARRWWETGGATGP
ncbi:LysR family transcriptional regulator [Streptomyces sp. NPDC004783]|uniref:LysR family transcriptional regulator n=1 Tax=Streptomyces sp. NPDC004783 TaxID=3154459 RepID=UPI0033A2FCD2